MNKHYNGEISPKLFIYFITIIIVISLPNEVKCLGFGIDLETFSAIIFWIIIILFILACIGYYSRKKRGYEPLNKSIKSGNKL